MIKKFIRKVLGLKAEGPLRVPHAKHAIDRSRISPAALKVCGALQEAGFLGRPMIIVRIGGRVPDGSNMPSSYFGSGGAFDLGETVPVNTGVVKLSDRKKTRGALASRKP